MNKIKKIYLIPWIFGILIIFLISFAITPLFKNIKNNSDDFIIGKNKLASLQAEIQNLDNAKKQNQEHQETLVKINTFFINSEVPIDFIRFLEKLAYDSDVFIKISFSSTPQNQPWPSLLFSLSLSGSYDNFSRFIEKIENAPYLIEIQNIVIKKISSEEIKLLEYKEISAGDVTANFSMKVFSE